MLSCSRSSQWGGPAMVCFADVVIGCPCTDDCLALAARTISLLDDMQHHFIEPFVCTLSWILGASFAPVAEMLQSTVSGHTSEDDVSCICCGNCGHRLSAQAFSRRSTLSGGRALWSMGAGPGTTRGSVRKSSLSLHRTWNLSA